MDSYASGFEMWAEFYETSDEIKELVSAADFSESKVLEIGCGSGRLTKRLSPRADEYYGIDIDERLLDYVRQDKYIFEDVNQLFKANSEILPFEESTFDIILDGWVTKHKRDVAFSEYKRVVKNDGVILLVTESWNEYDRAVNSEYVRMLEEYHTERDWYDLETELYEPLYDNFTTHQIEKVQIFTEYRFPSVKSAFRAFEFHITQYSGSNFPEKDRRQLWDHLSSMAAGENGPIQLSEHANLFIISPPVLSEEQ